MLQLQKGNIFSLEKQTVPYNAYSISGRMKSTSGH